MSYRYFLQEEAGILRRWDVEKEAMAAIIPDKSYDKWDPSGVDPAICLATDDIEMSEEEVFAKWPRLKRQAITVFKF